MEQVHEVTKSELAAAFTEWRRRFEEEPDRFASEAETAAAGAESYGDACAPYLLKIIAEQRADAGPGDKDYGAIAREAAGL